MTKDISVRVHLSLEDIENVLYSAAQGCDYWCSNSNELGYEHNVKKITQEGKDYILFDAENDKQEKFFINLKRIKRGITVMAKKYRHHFVDLINDNADMITADVLVQCALFGDVLYS